MQVCVVREPWRLHPLALIHRIEAKALCAELTAAGHPVVLSERMQDGALLRLSDPVMLETVRRLSAAAIPYIGPSAAVMERCYDKLEAWRIATANGIDTPATALTGDRAAIPFPLVPKPRRGSDSIGVRVREKPPVPRSEELIVQQHVRGAEVTIGVLGGRAGMPLHILLPAGQLYSFARKYLVRPRRVPLDDASLRALALKIAGIFGVDWAPRVDLILDADTGRAMFLECDAAPLVGAGSAFASSLEASGMTRAEQLRLLLGPRG